MARCLSALAVATLMTFAPAALADVLIIDKLEQAPAAMPDRGTSMDRVKSSFGEPSAVTPAVGDPPITRWEYPQFIVYFEHSFVIHAVEKRERTSASG
jgi:hypothetical protein